METSSNVVSCYSRGLVDWFRWKPLDVRHRRDGLLLSILSIKYLIASVDVRRVQFLISPVDVGRDAATPAPTYRVVGTDAARCSRVPFLNGSIDVRRVHFLMAPVDVRPDSAIPAPTYGVVGTDAARCSGGLVSR